ncbi:MAG: hypothetical protein AAGB11_01545 [Pseudomonadota bacterium]
MSYIDHPLKVLAEGFAFVTLGACFMIFLITVTSGGIEDKVASEAFAGDAIVHTQEHKKRGTTNGDHHLE